MLEDANILFISGSFYQYDEMILSHLKEMGANVYYYCSAPVKNHTLMRIYQRMRLAKVLYCKDILKKIKQNNYNYLLILNSARLTDEFIEGVCRHCLESKKILYCWDSLRTLPEVKNRIDYFDYIFSFDPKDSIDNRRINFLPLFYANEYNSAYKSNKEYLLSFVGFAHSDRYEFLHKIKKQLKKDNNKVYFYLFLPSILYYIRGKFISKTFKDARIKDFKYKTLAIADVLDIMRKSRTVIDYEVETQTGLTMRSIEALGMKCKLITTNKDVVNYDFYNPNNILVVDRSNPIIDLQFIETDYQSVPDHIYRRYSIDEWLKRLFFFEEHIDDKCYYADI